MRCGVAVLGAYKYMEYFIWFPFVSLVFFIIFRLDAKPKEMDALFCICPPPPRPACAQSHSDSVSLSVLFVVFGCRGHCCCWEYLQCVDYYSATIYDGMVLNFSYFPYLLPLSQIFFLSFSLFQFLFSDVFVFRFFFFFPGSLKFHEQNLDLTMELSWITRREKNIRFFYNECVVVKRIKDKNITKKK